MAIVEYQKLKLNKLAIKKVKRRTGRQKVPSQVLPPRATGESSIILFKY